MLLNVFEIGHASSVGCAYRLVTAAGSVLTPGTFFRGDLVMKKITIFSPFKKGSFQLLAKENVLSTCKLPRRLAQEVWIG